MSNTKTFLASAALALGVSAAGLAAAADPVKSVVLVHGGFVDGSGWQGVYDQLKAGGYEVTIVQNPTTSLAEELRALHRSFSGLFAASAAGGPSAEEVGRARAAVARRLADLCEQ